MHFSVFNHLLSYGLGDECDENTGSTTATTLPTSASTAPSTTLPPIAAIPVTAAPNIQVFHG